MNKLKIHIWGAIASLCLMAVVQTIWNKSADVVWAETAELVQYHPAQVQLHVRGYKVRDCTYIPDSEVGYVQGIGKDWAESNFQYIDDLSPNSSKPSSWYSRLSFGIWEWESMSVSQDKILKVMATVGHDCGGPVIRTTKIGPFSVKKYADEYILTPEDN